MSTIPATWERECRCVTATCTLHDNAEEMLTALKGLVAYGMSWERYQGALRLIAKVEGR